MSYLDVLLRKVIQIGGTSLTERKHINFVSGATAVDNPSTGATDITIEGGGGGGNAGKTVVAMADADQTLTDAEGRKGLVQTTGSLTVNRTVTFDAPSLDASSYSTPVLNTCLGASIVVSVGTGNEVIIEPGSKALVQISAGGVGIIVDLPLDPRDFGCPWNGVDDDLPGLDAMLASIPVTRVRRTLIQLPKGEGYCSDNWRINRNVEIRGHGRTYSYNTDVQNALKFPPLRGVILDGFFTSTDYPDRNSDHAKLKDVAVLSMQAIATDAGGNVGKANYLLDTTYTVWGTLSATVQLGSCVLRAGAAIGASYGLYVDGATRDTTHVVMFRCTTAGTKGNTEPAAFATADLTDLGTTISANGGGSAVWTVESLPKDYANETAYVAGQRVVVPGDCTHVFECEVAGTSKGWSTTIDAASDGATLPQATINVTDATGFPAAGTARVATATGFDVVTYTGTTGTTLTGCTGGTGTMATGGAVTQPFRYKEFGIAAHIPGRMTVPAYRGVFYDRSTDIALASSGSALPQATITVDDTQDFAASGTIYIWTDASGGSYEAVTYSGKTDTTFTGCAGGTGTMTRNAVEGQGRVGQGVRWKHIPSQCVTVLSNWVEIDSCALFGSTGAALWIQANADESVSQGYGYAGGSNFWAVRQCIIGFSGAGIVTNSNNTNGGDASWTQFVFLGYGRTNVDADDYLNSAAVRFGNGGYSAFDRTQGQSRWSNLYSQFCVGMTYGNALFTGALPSGNGSTFDFLSDENLCKGEFYYPAVVTNAPYGVSSHTNATVYDGYSSRDIRSNSALISNPAKAIRATLGPQHTGAAACFSFQHSDDGYAVGFSVTDEQPSSVYPTKWWTFGKVHTDGAFDNQMLLWPRFFGSGATWPSGEAVTGYGYASNLPLWFNNDHIWLGALMNVDPPSIGFGAVAPAAGHFRAGSVVYKRDAVLGTTSGWRCILTGTPGTWVPIECLAPASVPVSAFEIDWAAGKTFSKTLAGGANAITFANATDGQEIVVAVTGAASTLTWPTVLWPGGIAPTQTASGKDLYRFVKIGSDIYGSVLQAMA